MVNSFTSRGYLLKELNQTSITLIPKNNAAYHFADYRPISLCNVSYKIISKLLTHRLKDILPDLILPHQSGFIKGRLITDNILIANEILHRFHRSRNKNKHWFALKADIKKAYDKFSWRFLSEVLKQMKFPPHWIQMLSQCISTVTYKVIINGDSTDFIKPSCGLR